MRDVPPPSAAFLTGQFLLALPGIGDDRFNKAAILICAHDENGALGIDLGRPVAGFTLHDLYQQLEIDPGVAPDIPVLRGGPVDPNRGFVLHSTDWAGEESMYVSNQWVLTSTLDVLREIAEGRGPSQWLVAVGYSGWGEGQLDSEMKRHGWFPAPATNALLFATSPDQVWSRTYQHAGIDPRLLASSSGNA